jgi:hypothetical protein
LMVRNIIPNQTNFADADFMVYAKFRNLLSPPVVRPRAAPRGTSRRIYRTRSVRCCYSFILLFFSFYRARKYNIFRRWQNLFLWTR